MSYRPTERTEARRLAAREQIVCAAHELIAGGGYRDASVAAVAARAGVATGSVYRHFPSKADLFAEVFREASQHEVDATAQAALDAGRDASTAQKLAAAVATFTRRALRGRRLAWALLAEPVDPAVEAERLTYRRAYAAGFARLLHEGVDSGELAPLNVELAATLMVGAMAEALVGPLSPVGAATDEDVLVADLVTFCLLSVQLEVSDHVRS